MKKLFKFALVTVVGHAAAQAPVEPYANVNLVNVTGQPFELAMEVTSPDTGAETFKMTVAAGGSTGLFSQPPGKLEVEITMEGYDKLDGHLKLAESEANVYALYATTVEKKVKGETKAVPVLKFQRVKSASTEKGFSLTLVSFCAEPKLLSLGGKQLRIEPGQSQLLPGWTGKGFEIEFEGKTVHRIGESSEGAPFMTIVYEDAEKKLQFQHFRYELRD